MVVKAVTCPHHSTRVRVREGAGGKDSGEGARLRLYGS